MEKREIGGNLGEKATFCCIYIQYKDRFRFFFYQATLLEIENKKAVSKAYTHILKSSLNFTRHIHTAALDT